MSADYFIDTNIFIYHLEALDDTKSAKAAAIIGEAIQTGNACISFQVVQECINTILRKADIPLNANQTRDYLDCVLAPLYQVPATLDLYHRALDLQARYRYHFYDALIIAAALEADCSVLYSEDLQDGQTIEGLTIQNPFASATG